jgi:hypothetical protein
MNYEEEQDFRGLEALIKANVGFDYFNKISAAINHLIGEGDWDIIHDMVRRGLITKGMMSHASAYDDGYGITTAGRNKYLSLKRRKRNEKIGVMIIWVTLVFAGISALYGVLIYYKNESTTPRQQQKSTLTQPQPNEAPNQSLKYDTTKAQKTDSTLKKKNK